jgi:hypothetical protein
MNSPQQSAGLGEMNQIFGRPSTAVQPQGYFEREWKTNVVDYFSPASITIKNAKVERSLLDLLTTPGFGKRHVQCKTSYDCLPCLIFGQPALDGTPKVDDFLFGYAFEKVRFPFVFNCY